jgi:hypothetical protein
MIGCAARSQPASKDDESMSKPSSKTALSAPIREVVDNQLYDGTPPETRQTFERLIAQGVSAEEARRLIGLVVASEAFAIIRNGKPHDQGRFIAALHRLPKTLDN